MSNGLIYRLLGSKPTIESIYAAIGKSNPGTLRRRQLCDEAQDERKAEEEHNDPLALKDHHINNTPLLIGTSSEI